MTNKETKNTAEALPIAAPVNSNVQTVELDEPIVRNGQTINTLTVRRPKSGELRGTTLMALSQMDVGALQTVLPRICEPLLAPQEVINMDPADLMAVGVVVAGFFISKADKARFQIA
jgi:hypothetical protein